MPLLKVNQIASYSGNTLTIGTTGDTVTLAAGSTSSGFGATYNSGLNWTSTLVTSALTVSAGTGYFVNTSTAAITVTLPASPTFGSIVGINDYSGYASTNNITVNPNGNKLEGGTSNKVLNTNKESVFLTYTDTTRGWLATSGVNNGSDALSSTPYSIDFLVIAGGGGGGNANIAPSYSSGGGGAGGFRTSTQTANIGTVITVTVGDGGAMSNAGSNSSISGSGLTTITSAGGGNGGNTGSASGGSGGSGGGGGATNIGPPGGSGNTPSTSPSQGNNGGSGNWDSYTVGEPVVVEEYLEVGTLNITTPFPPFPPLVVAVGVAPPPPLPPQPAPEPVLAVAVVKPELSTDVDKPTFLYNSNVVSDKTLA